MPPSPRPSDTHEPEFESVIVPKGNRGARNDNSNCRVLRFPQRNPETMAAVQRTLEDDGRVVVERWQSARFPSLCFEIRKEVEGVGLGIEIPKAENPSHVTFREGPYQSRHYPSLHFER